MATIDEGAQDTLRVKVTNHLTGEITEVEVKNAEQAKNLLMEFNASERTLRYAKNTLRDYLDNFLGNDKEYKFADGKVLTRRQRTSLKYRIESLKKFLDEDQIAVCISVDSTATNALVQEMIERGEVAPNTLKVIRDEAEQISTKPYVEVR